MNDVPEWALLEASLAYGFKDRSFLATALAHPSYSNEHGGGRGNERLEFLGDAVLDLAISDLLYRANPDWDEGDLTRARAALVNKNALAQRARELDLGRFVLLGRTEQRSGGATKTSILANVFEAVAGALFLDGGLDPVYQLAERSFAADLACGRAVLERDAKTRFQEWAHTALGDTPRYRLLNDHGDTAGGERFEAAVEIAGEVWGQGVGRSKRDAEQAAARIGLGRAENHDG